jgi:molybdate transport system substrate-binding protein
VLLLPVREARAQEITVAAAADLQFAMQAIVVRFQAETGKSVHVVYGSSGNFFQQIQNGGPVDVFFSANTDYAQKLDAAGLAEPHSFYEYASGRIVLWVPNDSRVNLQQGLAALLDPSIRKIAIANPQHAPYGQAAVAALRKESLYDKVSARLVFGENISQAASFVSSGAVDAGIVALSLALSPNMKDKGRYVEIPPTDYPEIRQACVILKTSKNKQVAAQFLEFIRSQAVTDLLKTYGFSIPVGRAGTR